jgi:uncharacterized membrane protein YphA (DoxX/SURF4 family)
VSKNPGPAGRTRPAARTQPASRTRPADRKVPASAPAAPPARAALAAPAAPSLIGRASGFAGQWAPTATRVMLSLVLAWFGYHELMQPQLWTGYVPGVSATSSVAIVLVLAHGWLLLVLAVAIIAGIALRPAAAVAALLITQIVITLAVTGGLTDLTLRDVGVLGLAISLTADTRQRAVLRG